MQGSKNSRDSSCRYIMSHRDKSNRKNALRSLKYIISKLSNTREIKTRQLNFI